MELYAKGQLSFLILNCLLERDFYGLDIISEIKARTSGNVDLKKPSVYSNLTRMEKQGQVSSYMRSSDLGPNRRYYSITEKGRQTYQELKEEFERNHIDVFKDFRGDFEPIEPSAPASRPTQISIDEQVEEEEYSSEQDDTDFFDFSSLNEPKAEEKPIEPITEEEIEDLKVEEAIQPAEETPFQEPAAQEVKLEPEVKEEKVEEKNDAVFLTNENASEYNQRIYDISKDINRYRRRRSFAEDQIAISVEAPLRDSEERTKQKVEEFKHSLLENKNKYTPQPQPRNFFQTVAKKEEPVVEENDDGVFITSRMNERDVLKARKIEPPRLKIESPNRDKLPPPKRDVSIDPSHKEIISRIYARSKSDADEIEEAVEESVLYDFNDLKNYYHKQNINFKPYIVNKNKTQHNTNKLYLISSAIVFALFALLSGVAFAILNAYNLLNPQTNFLFIALPAVVLIDVLCQGYNVLRHTSWEPKAMMNQLYLWGLTILGLGAAVGLNFAFGLNTSNFADFSATLILPLIAIVMILPVRYYIKRTIIIKYWR